MKGVVLGGGHASRLMPLTKSLTKHCLPVYDQPMIYYPIRSLVDAGITEIMLVTNPQFMQQYIDLLGDGSDLGCNIVYGCQMEAGGIPQALMVAKTFVGHDTCCVILGDNIFEDDLTPWIKKFRDNIIDHSTCALLSNSQCHVVCKEVSREDAQHYGVLNPVMDVLTIVEKPKDIPEQYETAYAVTGLYMYTPDVFDMIGSLHPSQRGELEVSELNTLYGIADRLSYSVITGRWWDCGVDIDHMLEVSNEIRNMRNGF